MGRDREQVGAGEQTVARYTVRRAEDGPRLLASEVGEQYYAYSLILFFLPVVAWTSIRSSERMVAFTLIAVPAAMAVTEVTFSGHYRARGYYMKNQLLSDDDSCSD